jgi:hypothetical protein
MLVGPDFNPKKLHTGVYTCPHSDGIKYKIGQPGQNIRFYHKNNPHKRAGGVTPHLKVELLSSKYEALSSKLSATKTE